MKFSFFLVSFFTFFSSSRNGVLETVEKGEFPRSIFGFEKKKYSSKRKGKRNFDDDYDYVYLENFAVIYICRLLEGPPSFICSLTVST